MDAVDRLTEDERVELSRTAQAFRELRRGLEGSFPMATALVREKWLEDTERVAERHGVDVSDLRLDVEVMS